jgi:hypothetical protein
MATAHNFVNNPQNDLRTRDDLEVGNAGAIDDFIDRKNAKESFCLSRPSRLSAPVGSATSSLLACVEVKIHAYQWLFDA